MESRRKSPGSEHPPRVNSAMMEQQREMQDLDDFFSKKLTMKEIDSYLQSNKMQFNYNEDDSALKNDILGGGDEDDSESSSEEDDDFKTEDIIKQLLK